MAPQELLPLTVEVSIVIIGFAALVTTMQNVDQVMRTMRVRVIYQESSQAFVISLVVMVLLSAHISPETTWRIGSLLYLALMPFALFRINEDRKSIQRDKWSVWFGYTVIISSMSLQLLNLYIAEFWPLVVAISISLGLSLTVFIEFFRPRPLE